MIRILLIPSSDYLGHPFPQRHNHLFEKLNKLKNFEVHVLRFNFFYEEKLQSDCIIHEMPNSLKVKNSTALYYLTNFVNFGSFIQKLAMKESIDVIIGGNLAPPFSFKIMNNISSSKFPMIFDLQDYYPSSASGYISKPGSMTNQFLIKIFDKMLKFVVSRSDAITVPGIALAKYARNNGARRIEIIPNGISDHFLNFYDGKVIRNKLGIGEDTFLIGYVGSIEFWLDLEPFLYALSDLNKEGLDVKFLMVGSKLQTKYAIIIKKLIDMLNLRKRVVWLDFIKHSDVPRFISAIDVGIIPFNTNDLTAWYAAPVKLWEYLSQMKPVVSSPIPEALVNKDVLFIAKNRHEYFDVLKKLYYYKEDYKEMILKGYKRARFFLWDNSVKKIAGLIEDVVTKNY